MDESEAPAPFPDALNPHLAPRPAEMPAWARRALASLRRTHRLEQDYVSLAGAATPEAFARAALARLGITTEVDAAGLQRIPETGPLVIVSNHPFGGADGLVLLETVLQRRPDLRVLATRLLGRIAPLAPLMFPVDNIDPRRSSIANATQLRRALRWVRAGGALLMFPAGIVSHLDLRAGCVVDPPWPASAIRLLRAARATVLPVHVAGRNSDAFQIIGVVHPLLRTLMLPGELENKRGARIAVRIGAPWAPVRVANDVDDASLGATLRLEVYALAATDMSARNGARVPSAPEPVAEPLDPTLVAADVARLASSCLLTSCGHLDVYAASAASLPHLLEEVGRLREIAFRAAGEGTGRANDIDRFDRHYDHLFAWDRRVRCVVGAYRIGRVDAIRRTHGRDGLYVNTLFDLREPLLTLLGPTLELGRSFVRPEYQRSFGPLLALWHGIAAYVAREPRYARLIGPVSISASYDPVAIELLVRFLQRRHLDPLLSRLARPRTPFRTAPSMATLGAGVAQLPGLDSLSSFLSGRDPLGRGVPVLLRQYLKLGGRVLGFHVDRDFGGCVDCLTVVDLRVAPDAVLGKYMTAEQLAAFRAHWASVGAGRRPGLSVSALPQTGKCRSGLPRLSSWPPRARGSHRLWR